MEYEVVLQGGQVVTRLDGVAEHLTPFSRMVSQLHAAWENGVLPAPGGLFRQPARSMRLIQYYGSAIARNRTRLDDRRKAATA